MRSARNFFDRPADEQRALLEESWCDSCGKADLGIVAPAEFGEDGKVYIEGKCPRCGTHVSTEIVEIENDEKS